MAESSSSTSTTTSTITNLGGIYTDPFHSPTKASANLYNLPAPWYGGLRFLGRETTNSTNFTCIGCDDGIHFWTLTGALVDNDDSSTTTTDDDDTVKKVIMDFTPKAPGVGRLQCGFDSKQGAGVLHFYEDDGSSIGNTWSRLKPSPDFGLEIQMKHAAFNDVNGLYVDPKIFDMQQKDNNFAGIRIVSDRLGKYIRDEICVIGTDDGIEWWSISGGSFTDRSKGEFTIGSSKTAKCSSGTIQLNDGNDTKWVKMAAKMDIHSLPKA